MEKFSVDLEKVLDEFEFNEEREEQVPPSTTKVQPKIISARPPANNYRRPAFEPINLSEADFASSPPTTTKTVFNNDVIIKQKSNIDPCLFVQNDTKNRNYVIPTQPINVVSSNNIVNLRDKLKTYPGGKPNDDSWSEEGTSSTSSSLSTDEKPDLLEYKPNEFLNNIIAPPQLPDVTTSVRSLTNSEESLKNAPLCDLIHSSKTNFIESSECENLSEKPSSDSLNEEEPNIQVGVVYNCLEKLNDISENKHSYQSNSGIISDGLQEINISKNVISNNVDNDLQKPKQEVCANSIQDISKNSNEISNNQGVSTNSNNLYQTSEFQDNCIQSLDKSEIVSESSEQKIESNFPKAIHSISESGGKNDQKNSSGVVALNTNDDANNILCDSVHNELHTTIQNDSSVNDNSDNLGKEQIQSNNSGFKPMSFTSVNITDDELQRYLDDLDDSSDDDILENNVPSELVENTDEFVLNGNGREENLKQFAFSLKLSDVRAVVEKHSEEISSELSSASVSDNNDVKYVENIKESFEKNQETTNKKLFPIGNCENPAVNDLTVVKNILTDDDCASNHNISENNMTETQNIKNNNKIINKTSNNVLTTSQQVSTEEITKSSNQLKNVNYSEETVNISSVKEKLSTNPNSVSQKLTKQKPDSLNNDCFTDCDSLLSQESIEEDSIHQLIKSNAHNLDSPSLSSNSEYESFPNISAKMIPVKAAVESESSVDADEAGTLAEEERPSRPNSLELTSCISVDDDQSSLSALSPTNSCGDSEISTQERRLGKIAPVWVPDSDAPVCMQCQIRFTVIKRRHHCRACGQVLCSKCCSLKARLEFCGTSEVRVCQQCFSVLEIGSASGSQSPSVRRPNPNNPMEYCSTIPPLQQVAGSLHNPPPSVMVPVGVLKREGRSKSDVAKQVMFSDGIRPGGDLTELDGSGESRIPLRRPGRQTKRVGTPPGPISSSNRLNVDPNTQSFIPKDGEKSLPPVVTYSQGETIYNDQELPICVNEGPFQFAVNRNLNVLVSRVLLDCCVNRECWCISTQGLSCVGQDEVVLLLECEPDEPLPPKDLFLLINSLYQNAAKGTTVSEMSFTPALSNKFLGSRDHGGVLYIRHSYQCTAKFSLPSPPYLFAVLIHRWETPWARLFPIRLMLRLGAEFRYYPCPLVSVRNRPPLYTDIGHTIIDLLADFRKYSYTLPTIRGLVIHMEDRQTSILLPRNRYDQVIRALNNSNDSVLAFGANFSLVADSHLVCMQSTEDDNPSYHTQAINIHNKPRKVTGASFVVFNGALKTPGLAGKSNIVEDGLMVQVPSETMLALRSALREMHDYKIGCGPQAEETVLLQWTEDDTSFNIGVKSCIDSKPLDGVPSIRVHSGTDYSGSSRLIRWTEVFILQSEEADHCPGEPLDISRLSGSIAQATCLALVPMLDLLSVASLTTLAVRANVHPENVGYEAGGNGEKLPPIYMKSLDDELVPVLHQAALAAENSPATLELVFRIMEQ